MFVVSGGLPFFYTQTLATLPKHIFMDECSKKIIIYVVTQDVETSKNEDELIDVTGVTS